MSLLLLAAWRPILDPISLPGNTWWFTLVPLALGIAMSYKASRMPERDGWWKQYARGTIIMSVQIVALLLVLAVGLYLIVEIFAPFVATELNG
jgi:hypothetical protein